jgi:hypothetical protein
VVEHLPSKSEALRSNVSTAKKKKKESEFLKPRNFKGCKLEATAVKSTLCGMEITEGKERGAHVLTERGFCLEGNGEPQKSSEGGR